MKSRPNFTYRVTKNGKVAAKCQTHSIRRFCRRIRSIKWQKEQSVYLRVYDGRVLNNFGKMVAFYNDGYYQTRGELLGALSAFTEKDSLPEMSGGDYEF